MGCDIHLLVEIKQKRNRTCIIGHDPETDKDITYTIYPHEKWLPTSLTKKPWSDRIYGMFAVLAGVRAYGNTKQIVPNRGFPEDAAFNTYWEYTYKIWDREEPIPEWAENDNYITQEEADRYVKKYDSKIITCLDTNFVTCPDYHSANWCTTQEMEECVNAIFKKEDGTYTGDYIEWLGLLGAMKGYEQSGDYICRAVFWFDN